MLSRANTLRESIAREAALLLLRGKVSDFSTAKKKASRWYSKRRVKADDMPTTSEIQWHIDAIAGRHEAECRSLGWFQILHDLRRLCVLIEEYSPRIAKIALTQSIQPGLQILVQCHGNSSALEMIFAEVAQERRTVSRTEINPELQPLISPIEMVELRRLNFLTPVILVILPETENEATADSSDFLALEVFEDCVTELVGRSLIEYETPMDASSQIQFLLERLEGVTVSSVIHPEGDLLYHSLQTYQLGQDKHPHDVEFQWACLLHDVGFVIDEYAPHDAAFSVIAECIGERTANLISALPFGCGYLRGEKLPRMWSNDADCELLIDLARCDRDGRVPGLQVRDLGDVLDELNDFEQW